MRRFVLVPLVLGPLACSSESPQLPAAGEPCDADGQCAPGLDCVHLVCADDRGPSISVVLPSHLTILDGEVTSLNVNASLSSSAAGDQVEFIVDPAADEPHREVFGTDEPWATNTIALPAPLAVGPHHLRARVLDGEGQPYPNPSATTEIVVFVRDPDAPDTPQVAIVWPRSGHEQQIGEPLEVEVAVMPGSFTFVQQGTYCKPLPSCEPELDPVCEDSCGPVAREGHAKLYLRPDYPACLLDEPINCNGDYIASLRPGSDQVQVLDGYQLRGAIPADYATIVFAEPGSVPLTVALSYGDHDPFPSRTNVIHETITLQIVE